MSTTALPSDAGSADSLHEGHPLHAARRVSPHSPVHEVTKESHHRFESSGDEDAGDDRRAADYQDDDDAVSLDSHGLPRYSVRFPAQRFPDEGTDAPVPRGTFDGDEDRKRRKKKSFLRHLQFDMISFLRARRFWELFEFATRVTAIPVLIPSALLAAKLPHSPFISPFAAISATVLAAKPTVGEAVAYLFIWIRAGCLWLPLAVIAGALGIGHSKVAWCFYYTIILFLVAVFTEAMPRRICLLLLNSCLVGFLNDPTNGAVFPCRVMVDWSIGGAFCLAAAFSPYPIFCKTEAQRLLSDIARNTGTAFRGLVYSFWSTSDVERNMSMSKVRIMTQSLDVLLPAFEHSQAFSFFEFLFETAEARELRMLKFRLFERLRVNLSSMTRVLDMVEASPSAIDGSDRSQAFGRILTPHLNNVAEAFDECVGLLAAARTKKALLALRDHVVALRDRTDELQGAYGLARQMLFYEFTSDTLEEFVPLMTFYIFTVVCFRDSIDIFDLRAKKFKSSVKSTLLLTVRKTAVDPFMDNVGFVRALFSNKNRREVQRVIEGAKVSLAMILTIGFTFLIKVEKASFTGPNIIAFVSGMNPVEAVQASIVRLTGCLIGTVLGFFAGTYSNTPVQRVASLCALMFLGTFLRFDKEYGVMSVYAMLVLVPLDSVLTTTVTDTISRMNQNTAGIFIYLLVSILVLPQSPSVILRRKRIKVLRRMSGLVSNMMWFFSVPLVSELGNHSFSFGGSFADIGPKVARAVTLRDGLDATATTRTGHTMQRSLFDMDVCGEHPFPNRSMFMPPLPDTPMEALDRQIQEIMGRLKDTKEFMGFAKDERGLVTIDYPVKACTDVYQHMYRMTFLLRTMWLSWTVIRSQPQYTPETRRMMASLQPIARDVAAAFARTIDVITFTMKEPSINLDGDLMRAELDFIRACNELHTRKSKIMLILVHNSVEKHRSRVVAMSSSPSSGVRDRRFGSDRVPSAPQSPTSHGADFRVVPSERNVNVLPYLSPAAKAAADTLGPVPLPRDFVFPVTSADTEGLHSLTLCLEMFANETKLLMVGLGVMMDYLRSKL